MGSDSTYQLIKTVYDTSFIHEGLNSGTTYWYYIKAFSKRTISAESIHIDGITKSAVIEPTPEPIPSEKVVMGYATYYYNGDKSAYNSIVANNNIINEIVTHTYTVDGQGDLTGLVAFDQIKYAKENGIKVQASVSNQFSGAVAKELLESGVNRTNLIENILVEIEKYGFTGINIDIEGIYPANREHFSLFIKEAYTTLNSKGYLLTVAVPAKTYDSITNGWSGAFDYEVIGQHADQVVLMTYDEHWSGGTPGPIASVDWVRNVVSYATTVIPKEKILVGLAAYGYDWSEAGSKSYGVAKAAEVAATHGATIEWDSISQTPHYTYYDGAGIKHEVWYENSYSIPFKLNIVNEFDVLGVAIWRLGLEDAAYMNKIDEKL